MIQFLYCKSQVIVIPICGDILLLSPPRGLIVFIGLEGLFDIEPTYVKPVCMDRHVLSLSKAFLCTR